MLTIPSNTWSNSIQAILVSCHCRKSLPKRRVTVRTQFETQNKTPDASPPQMPTTFNEDSQGSVVSFGWGGGSDCLITPPRKTTRASETRTLKTSALSVSNPPSLRFVKPAPICPLRSRWLGTYSGTGDMNSRSRLRFGIAVQRY
jgi:hypothetical protein